MEIKSVNLDQPYSSLDIYHSNTDKALPGLVILPGGSYNQIMERDSERVALTFATHAWQTFVVRYPVVEHKNYEEAKIAVHQAFEYIVNHANELDVDVDRLGIIGFSAGGQIAAAYSNEKLTHARFAALGYPVIQPLIDERMGVTTENVAELVHPQTPPTFMWGSAKDELTPFVDHLQVYADALIKNDIPYELHEFGTGGHGIALANEYTGIVNNDRVDNHMGKWFPLFLEWLTELNLI
ncbi:alpha/beta hydrolase [Limosilactobacillus reuteri]|uniref:alpha/beta hydrolase n=1 Tax=Limosilactobacillus reuteri TaxID=1598 RepID=UPI001E3A41D9|nr:alpha/beta hydrolase [Limosilactobacillus reuteri]MCC4328334.1 alpha/beta hydrolase [Limosilactobacillus reuteri]MCC4336811.1 alpha/beta hydrolase [Limosilactobacillus reuteri]MCC4338374.1 alpha/beta hydrolase [Limosilactobacillus reuteri]